MRLHIGGKQQKAGWKILNISEAEAVDFVGDIKDLSAFCDMTCDEIYASHVLEHVAQAEVSHCLKGILRILKPGGKFYVSVPDLDILCKYFTTPNVNVNVKYHAMRMMFGGQIDSYDFHYIGWNQEFLEHYLKEAGFSQAVRVQSFGIFDDTSNFAPYGEAISLNMIAIR
jgi:SAM-dependent methyltransferase